MNTSLHGRNLFRTGAFAAATLACATLARAYDIPIAPELDGNSVKENWVSLSFGAFNNDGSGGSFQRRHQHEDAGFGGIDSFRYNRTVFGDKTLKLDGKAIVGDNDYLIHALLKDEANGWYLDAGFRENTVFYVGSGGYSPGGLWIQPFDDQLDLYRGELWLEAGLNKEAWSFSIRGSHSYRKGSKDSTMWGDSIYNGLGTAARKTVPALLDIDEERDSLEVKLGYEGEQLEAGAGAVFESIQVDNKSTILRNPGQANPTGNGQRYQVTTTGSDTDLFSGHVFAVSQVGDRLILSGAGSTTSMDTILSGDRWFNATPDGGYNPRFPRTSTGHGYNDLEGETQWDQWVLVGNAVFVATKNLSIEGGIRYENQTQDSISDYIETAGPATAPFEEEFENEGSREFDEVLTTIEANFTGFSNFVITPFAEYAVGSGSLVEEQLEGDPLVAVLDRDTEFDRDYLKYGIGGRWYPTTWFNGAAGVFRKERNNSYDSVIDNTPPSGGNRYPAYIADQDFMVDDFYVKGTVRANSQLSFTARYDVTKSEIESTEVGLDGVISSDQRAEIVSATLNWNATSKVALQAGVNLVSDDMVTGALDTLSAVAPTIGQFSSDYTTYTAMIMVALDETADLQFDYYNFGADNFRPVQAYTLPYGMDANEQQYGATYTKRISADLSFSLRVVLASYTEDSAGGNLDYDSQMIYGRMQMRF